jgi:hypothetical protein
VKEMQSDSQVSQRPTTFNPNSEEQRDKRDALMQQLTPYLTIKTKLRRYAAAKLFI